MFGHIIHRVIFFVALSSLTLAAPATAAVDGGAGEYDERLDEAKEAYADEDFDAAVERFIEVIQARPEVATHYRDLARSYFKNSEYAAAVAYYDFYLRQDPEADDRERVQKERALASHRAGGEVWEEPGSQRKTLEALRDQLEGGAAYTEGGGGAWGLYETLLRTGFAQPELERVRKRLLSRLIEEFEGLIVTESDQPTPQLDLDDWQVQRERLEAARSLTADEAMRATIERRELIVEAATDVLNRRTDRGGEGARKAVEENPDIGFVRWLEVVALVDAGAHDDALETVETLESDLAESAPQLVDYATMLRASILQRQGRDDAAADLYLELLDD
ncbi:MAG: tetratricopeptide repeat protein [Persicimonas sp.]